MILPRSVNGEPDSFCRQRRRRSVLRFVDSWPGFPTSHRRVKLLPSMACAAGLVLLSIGAMPIFLSVKLSDRVGRQVAVPFCGYFFS